MTNVRKNPDSVSTVRHVNQCGRPPDVTALIVIREMNATDVLMVTMVILVVRNKIYEGTNY